MADSYLIFTKVDDQLQRRLKLFDNGDGTFSYTERRAVDLSTPPARVDANVRSRWPTTREGIPFTIAGHPDIQTKNLQITAADGGQVGTAIIPGVVGRSIVVTKCSVNTDQANSGNVSVRIGFGLVNTPNPDEHQVIFYESSMDAGLSRIEGSGAGTIGIGADGEALRLSCTAPTCKPFS